MKKIFLYLAFLLAVGSAPGQNSLLNAQRLNGNYYKITSVGNFLETPPITVEAWIKTISGGTARQSILASINNGWGFYLNPPLKLEFGKIGIDEVVSNTNIPANAWVHVAVTYDGTHIKFYLDSLLSEDITGYTPSFNSGNGDYLIGRNTLSENFLGDVDEIRVWSTIRTLTQIKNSMNCDLVGNESGLLLYYKCNETSGATLADGTSNSHSANLQGGSLTHVVTPIVCLTGRENEFKTQSFLVFPNPANSKFSIMETSSSGKIYDLKLTDVTGRVLKLIPNQRLGNNLEIELNEFETGLYFLEIKNEQLKHVVKIIKE